MLKRRDNFALLTLYVPTLFDQMTGLKIWLEILRSFVRSIQLLFLKNEKIWFLFFSLSESYFLCVFVVFSLLKWQLPVNSYREKTWPIAVGVGIYKMSIRFVLSFHFREDRVEKIRQVSSTWIWLIPQWEKMKIMRQCIFPCMLLLSGK